MILLRFEVHEMKKWKPKFTRLGEKMSEKIKALIYNDLLNYQLKVRNYLHVVPISGVPLTPF